MNIFVLDEDPKVAASMMCNKSDNTRLVAKGEKDA